MQKNLESIFLAALDIEAPEARAAFVAETCGDDAALRNEVEQLLKSDAAAGSFLQKPVPEMGATLLVGRSEQDRSAVMEAGLSAAFDGEQAVVVGNAGLSVLKSLSVTLDVPRVALREAANEPAERVLRTSSPEMPKKDSDSRYQLQGEIARGGMGAILKGRDTDLGRDLAIKVLLEAHKDKPDVVQRFIEEAQIGGQLQHPGIAPVYELGQFADRRPYFSMKLVKGETLSKLLEERENPAVDRGRFLGIFEQICQTMAYAHSRGVIHRDLKPANVMVGAFGEVQVMDWGLAKVLQAGGIADEKKAKQKQQGLSVIRTLRTQAGTSEGSDVPVVGSVSSGGSETMAGSVMGTPAYMPPEQALGEVDLMDERSDVFGLGAILCEILTGQPPYVGNDGTQVYRLATRGKLGECFARLDACGAASVEGLSERQGASRRSDETNAPAASALPLTNAEPAASAMRLTNAAPVDAELIAITKQCLELEPQDRPRDAGVLAERISAHLASVESRLHAAELSSAAEAARAEEALQTAKEHELAASAERRARKLQMGLAAVVLCVLTIGGVAATWTAAVQSQLKNEALLAEDNAIKARVKEQKERERAEDQQAYAVKQQARAELEEARAKEAMQRAEAEKIRSINLLADMQTERGLQAARDGQPANAVLWFANAASLTPHDRERQVANQRRAQTWSGEALLPVAMLKLGGRDVQRIEFQSGGSLLMTVSKEVFRVWDWRNEIALPWSEQLPAVSDAAMSPDGKSIAALLSTGEVQLLEAMTGNVLSRFSSTGDMSLIEWSPDGSRVAVAGMTLQVWNVRSGEPKRESNWSHPATIGGLRFSQSGKRIASCSDDNLARVFAINEPSLPAPLYPALDHQQHFKRRETAPLFCDADRLLVTINQSASQPELHDATTGRLKPVDWKMPETFNRSLALSPDGRWIAAGGGKAAALLSVDGKSSQILSHANHLHLASFAPDGRSLVTLGYEGIARLFPLLELSKAKVGAPTIIPQQSTFANGAFSSDSQALAIAANQQIVIWERRSASPIVGQLAWAQANWRPRPSFDGQLVTPGVYHEYYSGFAPRGSELNVARMADGSAAGPEIKLTGLFLDSCICSDNASVAAVTVDETRGWLSYYDIATGTAKWPALALPAPPLSVAARPGRPQVAVLCENNDILVVDTTRGTIDVQQNHPGVSARATHARVAYSPDGATIVAVMSNSEVCLHDAETGQMRGVPLKPIIERGFARSIAFSPDGRLLATAVTGKNMAQVWSLATGEKVGVGMSHPGDVYGLWSIQFSPDGKRLVTGHKDGRVRTFDWQTGEMVGTPLQHPDEVVDVGFTPDGRHLLVGVRQATLHVWDVATGKLAVPLLPQLRQEGETTQSLGVAGQRAVVCSRNQYSVLDLSTLLPLMEEDVPSLLRRAELATNQKLQVGELVPLESHEWSTRWEQLVAARQTPEQVADSLAQALDAAADVAGQSLVIARAARRGMLDKLHALRPKSLPLSLAVALERSKQGRLDEALKLREQVLALLRESERQGASRRSNGDAASQTDFQRSAEQEPAASALRLSKGPAASALPLTGAALIDLAQLLTIDAPRGRWIPLEPTAMKGAAETTFTRQANGFILAGVGNSRPETYSIEGRASVKRISALRLDAAPHASLPYGGSGYFKGGNFHLTEVRARVRRADGTEVPLKLISAAANHIRPLDGYATQADGPWAVLDGSQLSRWDAWPATTQPLWLVLTPDEPMDFDEKDKLIVELDCGDAVAPAGRLGHFRLSVSEHSPSGPAVELVAAVRRNDLQSDELLAAACLIHGEAQLAVDVLQHANSPLPGVPGRGSQSLRRALLLATAQRQLGQRELAQQTVNAAVAESSLDPWPHSLTGFYQRLLRDEAGLSLSDIVQKREQLAAKRAAELAARVAEEAVRRAEVELAKLTQAIDLKPTDPLSYRARATYLAQRGRWKESAADLGVLMKLEPTNHNRGMTTGALLLMAGDKDGHRELCMRMLKQFLPPDPTLNATRQAEQADVICKLCLLIPGQVDRTLLPVQTVQETLDQNTVSRILQDWFFADLGLIAYRDGDYARAAALCEKSLEINDRKRFTGALALTVLSMAQHQLDQKVSAVKSLDDATALIPGELATLGRTGFRGTLPVATNTVSPDWLIAEILRREASLLIHQSEDRTIPFVPTSSSPSKTSEEWAALGEWDEAAKTSAPLLVANPRNRVELSRLAALQLLAGDIESYRKTCESGLKTFSGKITTDEAESLSKTCLLGDSGIAPSRLPIKQLRDAVDDPQKAGGRAFYLAVSALAAYRAGDWKLVVSESEKQTSNSGYTGALLLAVRALAEENLGQHEQAMKTLEEAESFFPPELPTLGSEKYTGALPVAKSVIQVDWLLAEVVRREAAFLVRKESAGSPNEVAALKKLAGEFGKQQQYDKAAITLRQALILEPQNAGLLELLGYFLGLQGEYSAALIEWRKAAELAPNNAATHERIGFTLLMLSRPDEAIAPLRKSVELNPKSATGHFWLGQTLLRVAQFDEAVKSFTTASELDRQSEHIQKKLAEAKRQQQLAAKLTDYIDGKLEPKDNDERIELAETCFYLKKFTRSVRFLTASVEVAQKTPESLPRLLAYNAACAAARVSNGDGDAADLPAADRTRYREQAVNFLRVELKLVKQHLAKAPAAERLSILANLKSWPVDSDLAPLHNEKEFWAEHAEVLK